VYCTLLTLKPMNNRPFAGNTRNPSHNFWCIDAIFHNTLKNVKVARLFDLHCDVTRVIVTVKS
jgi:hypothetical protein